MTNENKCMIINGLKYLLQMGYEIYSPWADPKKEMVKNIIGFSSMMLIYQ